MIKNCYMCQEKRCFLGWGVCVCIYLIEYLIWYIGVQNSNHIFQILLTFINNQRSPAKSDSYVSDHLRFIAGALLMACDSFVYAVGCFSILNRVNLCVVLQRTTDYFALVQHKIVKLVL